MLKYLRKQDYTRQISTKNLDELLGGNDSIRIDSEQTAYEKLQSYLVSRYDLAFEFRDVVKFVFTDTYYGGQVVYLDATAYSASATYALNDMVLEAGYVYYCKTAILVGEAFNPAKWTKIGAQYDLFNMPLPYTRFDYKTWYEVNDLVFWKDYNYKSTISTSPPTQQSQLQSNRTVDIPLFNSFPNATNQTQWTNKTAYSFSQLWPNAVPADFTAWSAGTFNQGDRRSHVGKIWQALKTTTATPGTDITAWMPISWVSGDSRNPAMIDTMLSLSIYYIHRIGAPRNIPTERKTAYDDAIIYLENVMNGKVNLRIEELEANNNTCFFGGSQPKRINNW